jgi:hypothetical protein
VRVLQQMVYNLPPDITLVRPSSLLNEPQVDTSTPNYAQPPAQQTTPQQKPRNPFRGVKYCKPKRPLEPVNASRFFTILSESISQSALVQYYRSNGRAGTIPATRPSGSVRFCATDSWLSSWAYHALKYFRKL